MNHTDACPNCCQPGIAPHAQSDDGQQTVSRYRCPRCGHRWTCSRLADAYPPPPRARRRPAA